MLTFTTVFALATTDDYRNLLDQRNTLSRDIIRNKQLADEKKKEATRISGEIRSLEKDIGTTQGKIDSLGGQIDETRKQINEKIIAIRDKEKDLKKQQNDQAEALRAIYESSDESFVYLLFSSKDLSEVIDRASYMEALEVKIDSNIKKITELRDQLMQEKEVLNEKEAEFSGFKKEQETYQNNLARQKGQKDDLKNMTLAQQKSYEELVNNLKKEITSISAKIYEERQKRLKGGKEALGSGSSGYPYSSVDSPDPWSFLTRECTSYAAWYWNVVLGKEWNNTRPGQGSAYNWPTLAKDQGYTVSKTAQVGAIISWSAGSLTSGWGHVAIVEVVNSDGTIDVSEYNWLAYQYSYRQFVTP
ncbi:MAG: CHAP domain-containing protein, partial [Patescibacteria group bacterium]